MPSTASITTAPGSVGEEDRRVAVGPVGDARQGVGADQEDLLGPHGDHAVGCHEAVDEPAARRVHVERAAVEAEFALHDRTTRGDGLVGRGGRQDETVDLARVEAGHRDRLRAGLDAELHGGAADVTLLDAGAIADPLVAGLEHAFEVLVREHLLGQGRAPPGDHTAEDSCWNLGHVRPSSARRSAGGP